MSRFFVVPLLFSFLALPFLFFFHVFPFADLPSYFFSSSMVALGFVFLVAVNGRLKYPNFLSILAVFLFLLVFLSILGGGGAADSRALSLYALVVLLSGFLACRLSRSVENYYVLLAGVVLAGAVLQALAAIILHYGLMHDTLGRWMLPASFRMTGLVAQSNLLALCVFFGFVSAIYLYLSRLISLGFLCVLSVLFGFVIAGSGSRAALLYTFFSFLVLCKFVGLGVGSRQLKGLAFAFFLLLLGVPLYFQVDSYLQSFLYDLGYVGRQSTVQVARDYTAVSFRLSEWRKALTMMIDNPLLGVGFGNYGQRGFWMGVHYPWAVAEGSFATHCHNLFLQLGAELGVVAFLAAIAFAGFAIYRVARLQTSPEKWLVLSIGGAFAVNAMLEFALWDIHFAVFLVFVLLPIFCQDRVLAIGPVVRGVAAAGVLGLWAMVSLSTADIYKKSLVYNSGPIDQLGAFDLRVAAEDSLWGREIGLLQITNIPIMASELAYQDPFTKQMMDWRPVNLTVLRRMQVVAITGGWEELAVLADAVAKNYLGDAAAIRREVLRQPGIDRALVAKVLDKYIPEQPK
ncbi:MULTISPECIES: O-antigen ligase family protein [Pseudomonas]|uniref:O-antigen ligase family protein n=1 Tax=Pseudomonas TaxID=286 RepID=UPI00257F03A0|nr:MULTISPECIES: O-antigen ligase family protein [Pseudomonas]